MYESPFKGYYRGFLKRATTKVIEVTVRLTVGVYGFRG